VGWIADVTNPRVAVMVGGVATLAACIPLAVRYRREHASEAGSAVEEELSDAVPGEVVDFAPGPIIDAPSDEAPVQLRHAGNA
jgi:hypothetical protein